MIYCPIHHFGGSIYMMQNQIFAHILDKLFNILLRYENHPFNIILISNIQNLALCHCICYHLLPSSCKKDKLPIIYIGVPLVDTNLQKEDQGPLVNKVDGRFAKWKGLSLSGDRMIIFHLCIICHRTLYHLSSPCLGQAKNR